MNFKVSWEKLRRNYDPESLDFKTTKELEIPPHIVGQNRALEALEFGLEIDKFGFNIYVAGPPGVGKRTAVEEYLKKKARDNSVPKDICYLNNFEDSYQPQVYFLPPGRGEELAEDMDRLVEQLREEIPQAFEGEDYSEKKDEILQELTEKRAQVLEELEKKAKEEGFDIQPTDYGIFIQPLNDKGKPLTDTELENLSEERRKEIEKKEEEFGDEIKAALAKIRDMEREAKEEAQQYERKIAGFIIAEVMDELEEKYSDIEELEEYFKQVRSDILDNIQEFKKNAKEEQGRRRRISLPHEVDPFFRRYAVNVLVNNGDNDGAPVIMEFNPTYQNLFGRVEKESLMGNLFTDFTLIRPGALHRAHGGYLILPVENLLRPVFSWHALKLAMRSGEIQIEELGELLGFTPSTKGLRPEPVPLNLKVVLVGPSIYYYLFQRYDREFPELFKVKAEFDHEMDAEDANLKGFISFICSFCRKEDLCPLEDEAVVVILEYAARLADDQEKLSARFGNLADIIQESHYWAKKDGKDIIEREHVEKTLEKKIFRSNLIEEKIREMIHRGKILIDMEGEKVGQVNGLSYLSLGDYQFGRPSRITASVGPGKEGVINIDREVELSGPIHNKGVMILTGFLQQRFGQEFPLAFSARLVFEQSYGGVDGDSASSAELYSLLSSLARVPLKQNIAVTGSVNQWGEIQSIGGVNEKIEGFFKICHLEGLTGEQGVIIPRSNVDNLQLKEEVVEAVKEGQFHIWAISKVEEGLEILTGEHPGEEVEEGKYDRETLYGQVKIRLREFIEIYKKLSSGDQ